MVAHCAFCDEPAVVLFSAEESSQAEAKVEIVFVPLGGIRWIPSKGVCSGCLGSRLNWGDRQSFLDAVKTVPAIKIKSVDHETGTVTVED